MRAPATLPVSMSAPVQLVFRGEVLAGFRLEDVQRDLARLLRADEAGLKRLFSGQRTVLKRGLAAADAQRYVSRLAAVGARLHVEPMPAPPTAPAASGWPAIAPPPEEDRRAAPPIAAPPPPVPMPVPAMPTELALVATAPADEVVCPTCGERQTRRVLCRSCATNLEMALAAKAEDEALRRAERQAALEARRNPRRHVEANGGERSASAIGLSFSGRVGRLSSATANLWLIGAMLLLTAGFLQRPSLPRLLLVGVGALGVFFFSMRLTVLRCHDCDRHGWWALFVLVPYAGSLASLLIGLLPGNPGTNEYGPPPPRGRWRWFGLSLVVLVLCSALLVRGGLRFAERYAAEQADDGADDIVELGGDGRIGGGSGGGAALQEALRDYAGAPGHKAFAASSRQTFAWAGNASSLDEAVREAMAQCDARRKPYTPDCRVVNVNGQAVR